MTGFNPETQKIVPILPSHEVLIYMAVTMDNGFIMDKDPDLSFFRIGYMPETRDEFLNKMHAVYSKVAAHFIEKNSVTAGINQRATEDLQRKPRNSIVFAKEGERYALGYSIKGEEDFQKKLADQKNDITGNVIVVPVEMDGNLKKEIAMFIKENVFGEKDVSADELGIYDIDAAEKAYEDMCRFRHTVYNLN